MNNNNDNDKKYSERDDKIFANLLLLRAPKKIDTRPEIDAIYLRTIMPIEYRRTIKNEHLDTIEANCVKYMEQKAKGPPGAYSCTYHVPDLFPGIPNYDKEIVANELCIRLQQRHELLVNIDSKFKNQIHICWDPLLYSSSK